MIELLRQDSYRRDEIKAKLDPILCRTDRLRRARADGERLKVLLKPNFVMPAPRTDASTTHPEFYMAVAELLLDYGFAVGIGESPAIGTCARGLKAHGVLQQCRQRGIDVVEFKANEDYAGVAGENAYSTLTIAAELSDWDCVINLPKLKTHQQFTFTGATKNLYGCVTGKRKFVRHNQCGNDPRRFARMIRANAAQADCVLHIGDGIDALHVKGPRNGKSFPLNSIIVASDHLVHDWLFCRMINLDPVETPLFADLSQQRHVELQRQCDDIVNADSFRVARDFVHAPLINISFAPWQIVRSGWRTLRHHYSGVEQAKPSVPPRS